MAGSLQNLLMQLMMMSQGAGGAPGGMAGGMGGLSAPPPTGAGATGPQMPNLGALLAMAGQHEDNPKAGGGLAHIGAKEAQKLAQDGGAGTINPITGLPQFYDVGASGEGRGADRSNTAAAAGGGGANGGNKGGGNKDQTGQIDADTLSFGNWGGTSDQKAPEISRTRNVPPGTPNSSTRANERLGINPGESPKDYSKRANQMGLGPEGTTDFSDRLKGFFTGLMSSSPNTLDPAFNTFMQGINMFNPITGWGMRFTNAMQGAGFPGAVGGTETGGANPGNNQGSDNLNAILAQIPQIAPTAASATSMTPTQTGASTTPAAQTKNPLEITGSSSVQYPWAMWG